MKRTLMATAAVAALLAGPALAQTQQAPPSRIQSPAPAPGEIQKAPAERIAPPASSVPKRGVQDRTAPDRSTTGQGEIKSEPGIEPKTAPKSEPRMKDTKPGIEDKPGARTQERDGKTEKPTARPTETKPTDGKVQTETQTQTKTKTDAKGATVKLTTEQRSKLRTTVVQSSDAPRVKNVTFAVRVGTVVPRTVRVVALPPPLIEIYPQWRGYMYFVYANDIIVVEPDTLRIVAVITV